MKAWLRATLTFPRWELFVVVLVATILAELFDRALTVMYR